MVCGTRFKAGKSKFSRTIKNFLSLQLCMFLYQSKNGAESASVVNVCGLNSVEVVAQVRTGKSTVCAADIYNLMTVCDLSQ